MKEAPVVESLRALAALCERPGAESARLAELLELGPVPPEAAWSDLFLFQLPPYASVYLGADGHIGGEARDRIAGFWRALGLAPPAECDHLAVMLAFLAELGERQERADGADAAERDRWRHVRRAFLWEHLLSWAPPYLIKLTGVAPGFFGRWAERVGEALGDEAAGSPRPPGKPLHWRSPPPLADPRIAGGRAFLDGLLTPAASGLLLVRGDLERASRDLGLALRIGERRFQLEALLSQEPGPVLGWLAAECGEWRRRLARSRADGLAAGSFWLERAAATAALLEELRADAG